MWALKGDYLPYSLREFYITPLQGYYSEALPIPARLKRRVFRLE